MLEETGEGLPKLHDFGGGFIDELHIEIAPRVIVDEAGSSGPTEE